MLNLHTRVMPGRLRRVSVEPLQDNAMAPVFLLAIALLAASTVGKLNGCDKLGALVSWMHGPTGLAAPGLLVHRVVALPEADGF